MRLAMAVVLCLCVARCGSPDPPSDATGPVLLLAAASTTEAVEELQMGLKDVAVRTSFAASSALAQQVLAGAEAHIFLSASEEWADALEDEHLVADRRDLLSNRLVIVVPNDSTVAIDVPEDLLSDDVQKIALGDPASVPAGKYAKEALTRLGLWERLERRVVAGGDVRHALFFVERGEADAGVVYATDAAVAEGVRVALTLDPQLHQPIRYPLVLLKAGEKLPDARRVFDYLQSPAALDIFRRHGFTILGEDPL